MKKVVLKLDLHDDKDKQKALKAVTSLSGIDSISMDMKEKKLTVIGPVDPVDVVKKLRKLWHTEIVSVGPPKEPEKKKEEPKKEEPKKEEAKKEDDKKKDQNPTPYQIVEIPYRAPHYYPYLNHNMNHHYYPRSAEEDPNSCVIC